ncbi:TPA: cellulose biosynthesis cyclic di-GMP-binding regulatory protein BcsB [Escherichia coli]|nr:cellulose biosynthesis cyclic di-GMP-binding regulatory protein BcsB [Escherichia coli]HBA1360906.1 cellulose biosynthesis cyclic di-GMP-binding regulatory protein BcsB [Escherichia coli]
MKRKIFWICAVALGMSAFPSFMTQATPATQPLINAEPAVAAQAEQNPQVGQVMPGVQGADAPVVAQNGPSRDVKLTFAQIAPPPGSMVLRGINPNGSIEFGMRSDEVVTKAMLNLEYTPSPSLLPVQSQLKVYLNDELMGVLPVTKEQLGKKTLAQMPINPLFITDFNRVRLEFVGHYQDVCENPASTTLWLDVGRSSGLDLTYQTLNVKNDLSHFPVPFFDPRDNRTNTLPMVFAGAPDVELQQASAIVASWFGSRSGWRGQNFPVLYNQLPDRNAIVFATNDKRPDFLRDHPAVKAPVIEMINHPQNPYVKLLVVFGRDDKDLLQAAKGIAQGNILFRGESVVVNEVKPLLPRKPYDAPNWVRTDRPVTFGELKTYEEQLQSSGLEPAAINVSLNLPPDLYLMRSTGIDMDINYRYTMPPVKDSSRMDISLNNQFLQSFNLSSKQEANRLLLRIPVLQGLLDGKTDVSIPALKLGATNQLRFDFEYMNPMPGGSVDNCITFQPVQNHVVIGDDSTIDFSKYYHFIPMPDLRAFANAGFPFSRMADLSQTITVMPKTPNEAQMETLLNTVGFIGAQTGFPAINLTVTDDGSTIQGKDADIMIVGGIPDKLKDDKQIDLLVQATESWVKTPMRQTPFPGIVPDESDRAAETQSTLTSSGAMAAVIGFQSPYNDQRSVIALLAAFSVQAACTWPAWEQFKKDYISQEGRVIDPSDARKITTSEGQSYGMFFALAANDRAAFDNLLDWTQNNLAQGSLKEHLPAWLWGKKENSKWEVLDSNSASDGDVWMAWSLLEAGRLWKEQRYTDIGSALLKRIAREEVVTVPGLGSMLLPGKVGFAEDNSWRFNPSYLPPTLAQYFTRFGAPWTTLRETNQRLLLETAPKGFSPDWVRYEKDKGWQLKAEKTLISSYDAIRVYMWVGMMPDSDPQKARMLNRFKPMATFTEKNGYPPEKVDVATGKAQGKGPVGFSAAMLPFLQNRDAQAVQRQRVADNFPGSDAYYNYVLTLFGQGWDQHRFRFSTKGELLPDWGQECANSH